MGEAMASVSRRTLPEQRDDVEPQFGEGEGGEHCVLPTAPGLRGSRADACGRGIGQCCRTTPPLLWSDRKRMLVTGGWSLEPGFDPKDRL